MTVFFARSKTICRLRVTGPNTQTRDFSLANAQEVSNVRTLKYRFGRTLFGHADHGDAKLLGGQDVGREHAAKQREKGLGETVKDAVSRGSRPLAMRRFNGTRAEYAGSFERQTQDGVFRFSLNDAPT